jgi:GNAT superfamily N-acetyltransferase
MRKARGGLYFDLTFTLQCRNNLHTDRIEPISLLKLLTEMPSIEWLFQNYYTSTFKKVDKLHQNSRRQSLIADFDHPTDLEIVGTAVKYQRQGAGSMLLQYGCDRADEQGYEAFLEAAPEALRLYHKFGFETAAQMDTLIKGERFPQGEVYTKTFMVRQPHKS